MTALLGAVSWPYARANVLRILLTVFGVVIGVQGMVAMGALNRSVVRSFEQGIEAVAGDAALQISGPETGVPEPLVGVAERVEGVESATAVIQSVFTLADEPHERITVFGIDLLETIGSRSAQFPREHVHIDDELEFLNARDSIALAQPLMDRLRLTVGSSVRLATESGLRTFTIRGTLDPVGPAKVFGGAIALVDLGSAQELALAPGLVQTIYVVVQRDASVEAVRERLRAAIGDRARVERTAVRGEHVDAVLGSLRVALSIASLVTMIVAFFIIYQTVAISVEQRRRDIAISRSLGFTRTAVVGVFVAESLAVGTVASLLGIAGGYVLARLSLHTAVAGISDTYVQVVPGEVTLPLVPTAVAAAFGIVTALLAALIPALHAAGEPPARVLRSTAGIHGDRPSLSSLIAGSVMICVAILVLRTELSLTSSSMKTLWIMTGHALLLIGIALLSASYVAACARAIASVGSRGTLPVSLAVEFFSRRPRRAAATVSAIMVGYALVVVLGATVHSIQRTLSDWLRQTFAADLIVLMPPGLSSGTFDGRIAAQVSAIPGVSSVGRFRAVLSNCEGHPCVVATFDQSSRPDSSPLMVISREPTAYRDAALGDAVFISDSFAFRYGKHLGDVVTLDTAYGKRSFRIAAVARDYAMDLGTVLVSADVYQRLWNDSRLTNLNVWLTPSADVQAVRNRVVALLANDPRVNVVTNAEFREEVAATVRSLLKVLGSLQIFACAIAMFGVINFLLAAVLDRRREIALLRSVGVTRRQIRTAVVIEAGLIGATGATLGLVAGFPGAFYMVTHSIRTAMGWSLQFDFPVGLAAATIVAITAVAAAAGYLPARRISAGNVLAGLHTE